MFCSLRLVNQDYSTYKCTLMLDFNFYFHFWYFTTSIHGSIFSTRAAIVIVCVNTTYAYMYLCQTQLYIIMVFM